MVKDKIWQVIIYTMNNTKIIHEIDGSGDMAMEYATLTMERGDWSTDERGVVTFIPIHRIFKVKVVPPGVKLIKTRSKT